MSKIVVFFDSWCPVCTKIERNIKRLDTFRLIEFKSIRNSDLDIGVPKEDLEKEMHCLDKRTGTITVGIDAIASITARVPLLMILWFPIKLSSKLGFGHKMYHYIASTRTITPVNNCTDDSCQIRKVK